MNDLLSGMRENLKDPNTVFGGVMLTAAAAALTVGDRWTQGIAVIVLFLAGAGFILTTASRREAVLTGDLKKLPPNQPVTPAQLLEHDPAAIHKREEPDAGATDFTHGS